MTNKLMTAQQAFAEATNGAYYGKVNLWSSPFVCPYPDCRVFAEHSWGRMTSVVRTVDHQTAGGRELDGSTITVALCQSCKRDVVFVDAELVRPRASEAPAPAEDMPVEIIAEYTEAAAILPGSPRGAAALLRLGVQKLLPLIGATKRDINDQIAELVAKGVVSARVQEALDALRVIGNEAVHPGTIDLRDDIDAAMGLFRLLNFIVEKAISDPKHAEEMFARLPQGKRDAIVRRDNSA